MKKEQSFLIIPDCDESNRGDQALIWETVRIAKDAGFNGKYYMTNSSGVAIQSKEKGIESIGSLLPHPSTKINVHNNIKYGGWLKFTWGVVSFWDFLLSLLLLFRITRSMIFPFLNKRKKDILTIFLESDAVFVKGGGFLHAYGGLLDAYKIYYHLFSIMLAISLKIPVYIMPNSYGPFNDWISKKLIKYTLEKCEFVSTRETISAECLRKFCNKEIFVTNDLAVYLKKQSSDRVDKIFSDLNLDMKKNNKIAITVRPYRFPESVNPSKAYEEYKKSIEKFIRVMQKEGYQVVMIEHVYSKNLHENDIQCIQEILDLIPSKERCPIVQDRSLNCEEMKELYSRFDYIIGTRFHSVIFSIMEQVPAIAITYGGNKGQGIMRDLGMQQYALDINEISFDKLYTIFDNLRKNKDNVRKSLKEYGEKITVDRENLINKMG